MSTSDPFRRIESFLLNISEYSDLLDYWLLNRMEAKTQIIVFFFCRIKKNYDFSNLKDFFLFEIFRLIFKVFIQMSLFKKNIFGILWRS